jgi:hypothetical protein
MPDSLSDPNRNELERQLADLMEEYDAADGQLRRELSAANRVRIQREIDHLYEQMERVQAQLHQLESSGGDPNRRHLGFEDKIPEIDYEPAATIVQTILTGFDRRGGAALFLLQRSVPLGGVWFVTRMKRFLESRATCVRHCRREIPPHGRWDEFGLLDLLADEFGVERVPEDADAYARAIIRAIRGFVRGSTTLLIDVRRWDDLCPQERVLPWFLEHFWTPLVHELPAITETYRNVKFVGILSASHEIPQTCLGPPYCCTPNDPDEKRVLELPLQKWTREEIQEWLEMFSSLPAPRIEQVAQRVYDNSAGGTPSDAYRELSHYFA